MRRPFIKLKSRVVKFQVGKLCGIPWRLVLFVLASRTNVVRVVGYSSCGDLRHHLGRVVRSHNDGVVLPVAGGGGAVALANRVSVVIVFRRVVYALVPPVSGVDWAFVVFSASLV